MKVYCCLMERPERRSYTPRVHLSHAFSLIQASLRLKNIHETEEHSEGCVVQRLCDSCQASVFKGVHHELFRLSPGLVVTVRDSS